MDEVKAQIQDLTNLMLDRFEQIDKRFTELRTELKEDIAGVRAELKEDIAGVRAELKEDIANVETNLRGEISTVETNLRDEISAVERNLRGEISAVETNLRGEISAVETNLRDEVKALEHNTNVRFDELAAGQAKFQAQLTRLERGLFYEEGSREVQADVLYREHKGDAKKLRQQVRDHEQRLKRLERQAA